MRSVPPRGSGWVVRERGFYTRTHPLPRGGTDLMTLALEISHSFYRKWFWIEWTR